MAGVLSVSILSVLSQSNIMRHTSVKEYEKALNGGEPVWRNDSAQSLTRALNWYNYHSDNKESKKYALNYLKEVGASADLIQTIQNVPEYRFQNLGFVCRMKLRGAPLRDEQLKWIDDFFQTLKQYSRTEEKTEDEPQQKTVSIQERVQDKAKEFIAEFEAEIDTLMETKKFTGFDPYKWFVSNNIKGAHVPHFTKFFQQRITEFEELVKGKTPVLVEGYSNFTKQQAKEYLQFLRIVLSDCEKIAHNAKLTRAPRKKKAKPVDKVVASVQYKKEDNEYKVASIKPTDILGASQLWVFNTKTRKLCLYVAQDKDGLGIKGTTLQNYNEELSIQKTLRKPEDVLPLVLKQNKTALKKSFDAIKSAEQKLTGRLNTDTILLRAIK